MVNYATAKRTGPAGGIGDLKTREDFNRAADIAVAARDKPMLMRVLRLRDQMFGGETRGRSAAGDLAKINAVLAQIKNDEAREAKAKPKRFASPVAAQMAALSAACRRISSRVDQAKIAAALKAGHDNLYGRKRNRSDQEFEDEWNDPDEDDLIFIVED